MPCSAIASRWRRFRRGSPEDLERGFWTGKAEFTFSLVGYLVGLGNFWRFPDLCYKNGGDESQKKWRLVLGAFIIAYLSMVAVIGIPVVLLELSLGQFSSLGVTGLWACTPMFKGIGYTMCLVSALTCIYYNVLISYCLYYMGSSFTASQLPWTHCNNTWNTPHCIDDNKTSVPDVFSNSSLSRGRHPAEEFWLHEVLRKSASISEGGPIHPPLCACLCVAWFLVFLCLIRGIKSTGKVMYVTVTSPYILITALIIGCSRLDGAREGLIYYMTPQCTGARIELRTWESATKQVLYSFGLAFGGLATLASYNDFNYRHLIRDSVIVSVINACSSIYAGAAVFSVIGFVSKELGQNIDFLQNITDRSIIFITYPTGLTQLDNPPAFAGIFFLSFVALGIDSQVIMFETFVSAAADEFPRVVRKYKILFTGVFCLAGFLLGLYLITPAGPYWVDIIDGTVATYTIPIALLLEVIVITYVYGMDRLCGDIKSMIYSRPNYYWRITWRLCPLVILFVIGIAIHHEATGEQLKSDGRSPGWVQPVKVFLTVLPLLPILMHMLYECVIVYRRTEGLRGLSSMHEPAWDWGPALPEDKEFRRYHDVIASMKARPPRKGDRRTTNRDFVSRQRLSMRVFSVTNTGGGIERIDVQQQPGTSNSTSPTEYRFTSEPTTSPELQQPLSAARARTASRSTSITQVAPPGEPGSTQGTIEDVRGGRTLTLPSFATSQNPDVHRAPRPEWSELQQMWQQMIDIITTLSDRLEAFSRIILMDQSNPAISDGHVESAS